MIAWVVLMVSVEAAEPEAVLARVDEIAAVRSLRTAEAPPAIPREAYVRAASGRVETGLESVEGHRAKKAWGVSVVDVPVERLWAAINDDEHHVDYTKLSYSELLTGRRCVSPRSLLQFLPVPLISDRWWITHLTANERIAAETGGEVRELSWRSSVDPAEITSAAGRAIIADGTPIAFTKGAWFLARVDAGATLVEYYVWTDPGGRVPAGPASSFAAGGISDTIEGMVALASAGPGCPVE